MTEPEQGPISLDTERAAQLVDQAGSAIAGFASRVGFEAMKVVALARENAEDILAEAQNVKASGPRPE